MNEVLPLRCQSVELLWVQDKRAEVKAQVILDQQVYKELGVEAPVTEKVKEA